MPVLSTFADAGFAASGLPHLRTRPGMPRALSGRYPEVFSGAHAGCDGGRHNEQASLWCCALSKCASNMAFISSTELRSSPISDSIFEIEHCISFMLVLIALFLCSCGTECIDELTEFAPSKSKRAHPEIRNRTKRRKRNPPNVHL